MSSPYPSKLPPDLYTLGDVQAEYPGDNLLVTGLVAAGIAFGGGVLMLILFLATGYYFPVLVFLVPIGIVGGLITMAKGLIDGRKTALVFKDAVAEVKRGQSTVMRWDEISAVHQSITTNRRSGSTTYTYTVTSPKGKIVFSTYKGIQQLGATIVSEVNKRLGPRITEVYNSGQPVQFGKVSVSKSGIDIGKGMMPWTEIQQVSMSNGRLFAVRGGKTLNGPMAGEIPNVHVLMGIVTQITNKPTT